MARLTRWLAAALAVSVLAAWPARAQVRSDDELRRFLVGTWRGHHVEPTGTHRWRRMVVGADGRVVTDFKTCVPFPRRPCGAEPAEWSEPLETAGTARRVTDREFTLTRHWLPPFSPLTTRYSLLGSDSIRMEAEDPGWSEEYRRER
jgi:hypothetical protein